MEDCLALVPISSHQLARALQSHSKRLLLVDVRPSGQFCANHISGAENLNFSNILLRRLLKGVLKLETMLTSPELIERVCRRRHATQLVLCDLSSTQAQAGLRPELAKHAEVFVNCLKEKDINEGLRHKYTVQYADGKSAGVIYAAAAREGGLGRGGGRRHNGWKLWLPPSLSHWLLKTDSLPHCCTRDNLHWASCELCHVLCVAWVSTDTVYTILLYQIPCQETAPGHVSLSSPCAGGFQAFVQQFPELCEQSNEATSTPIHVSVSASLPISLQSGKRKLQLQSAPLNDSDRFGPPVELLPHLILGCAHDSADFTMLEQLGVTAILNVSHNCPSLFTSQFEYMEIRVPDTYQADLLSKLDDAFSFIGKCNSKSSSLPHSTSWIRSPSSNTLHGTKHY